MSENLESESEKLAREIIENQERLSFASASNLGKATKFKTDSNEIHIAGEVGWKNIPIENLPSKGLFYEDGTQMAIRAASVAEIRHWSTIDDGDIMATDDVLNFIMDRCVRIKQPGKPNSFKDVKEIDRFYLIFAVRDFTFKNGENKLYINAMNSDGVENKIEITKDNLDYFNADEKLMNFYSSSEHCFNINMKNGENFKLHLPSLGTMSFIKNYLKGKQQAGHNFDKAFIKYAPFLFPDWKMLNQNVYEKESQNSTTWSLEKLSVMDKIVEMLSSSVNAKIRYISSSGMEESTPLNFPGGIKSIFLISNIFGELV